MGYSTIIMRRRCNFETIIACCSLPVLYILLSQLRLLLVQQGLHSVNIHELERLRLQPTASNAPCLGDECVNQVSTSLSKIWKQRPLETWCHSPYRPTAVSSSPKESGLILVKVPKSASSTVAGMALQLGHSFNCSVSWEHRKARDILLDRQVSFMLAPIRNPYSRALSHVYFHKVTFHGRQGGRLTDTFIISQLNTVPDNYIIDYIRPDDHNVTTPGHILETISRVLDYYDFLLVVERMDESIVVLSWILGVPVTALLTLSSKQANSWYLTGKTRCVNLVHPVVTDSVKQHFDTARWKQRHHGDVLLHAVAVKSLDNTIEAIGPDQVRDQVRQLQRYKEIVREVCSNRTDFPCSDSGQPQWQLAQTSCLARDFGCGYKCINDLFNGRLDSIYSKI